MSVEVNLQQRMVVLDGKEVSVGSRAFDVMHVLFENADRIVSKEELLDKVWAGLFVEESNLTVQIATLRKALGRDLIKTVPGVGYKLALPGAEVESGLMPLFGNMPTPDKTSLAVLPFVNLTGSDSRDYLVEGIVNEITSSLSRLSAFFVVSNTSTYEYRGKPIDLAEVGKALGVRYLLEGSVQQSGETLRVVAQLVEARSGHVLWDGRIDGTRDEMFDLQAEVAERVAGALEPKLIYAEAKRLRSKPTESLKAHDLWLRAMPLIYRMTSVEKLEEALDLLGRAIAIDPGYTAAKATFSFAKAMAVANRHWTFEQAQGAIPIAREVIAENPDDALALVHAGATLAYIAGDLDAGVGALKRAVSLNPNLAIAFTFLGWMHCYRSDGEKALAYFDRAIRLSPLAPEMYAILCGKGNAELELGNDQAALEYLNQSLADRPDFGSAYFSHMACSLELGETESSAKTAELLRQKVPDLTISTFLATRANDGKRYRQLVETALRFHGFPE